MPPEEFDYPGYVLDLRHRLNCATIESAKRGMSTRVLVRPQDDEVIIPIPADGRLSDNGEEFTVTVSSEAGIQTHTWKYEWLLNAIRVEQDR